MRCRQTADHELLSNIRVAWVGRGRKWDEQQQRARRQEMGAHQRQRDTRRRGPATRPCPSVAGKAGSPASIRSRAPASGFAEPGVPPSPPLRRLAFARGLECSTGGLVDPPVRLGAAALADELTRSWSPWLARTRAGRVVAIIAPWIRLRCHGGWRGQSKHTDGQGRGGQWPLARGQGPGARV